MARETFGRTWWGSTWIEALESGDYIKEQLDEGKNYALRGNVLKIEIKDGNVLALVQNNEIEVCNVTISLEKFSQEEKSEIKKIISTKPSIASELSLGNLPSELIKAVSDSNIELIPVRWQNINSSCSCSEQRNPCKHISAVYYILSNEIDKNPFLIFELKNMSSQSLMNSSGMVVKSENHENNYKNFIPYDKVEIKPTVKPTKDIDLSFTDLKIKSIFKLLPDHPLFYEEENFKLLLIDKYRALSSFVDTINIEDVKVNLRKTQFFMVYNGNGSRNGNKLHPFSSYFLFSHEYYIKQLKAKQEFLNIEIPMVSNGSLHLENKKMKEAEVEDVLNFFLSLPLNLNPDEFSESAMFMNLAASIALRLVKSFSFIPEVVTHQNGEFSIQYIPLIHDEKTSNAVEYLKSITPPNLIFRLYDKAIFDGEIHIKILSLFISFIVHLYNRKFGRNYYFSEQKVYYAFFRGEVFKPEKFEEENTGKIITDWLERISFHKRILKPVVIIENNNHEKFSISVEIENKLNGQKAIPLSEIFGDQNQLFKYDIELVRTEIAREIKIASEYFPPLLDILNTKGEAITINSEMMFDFISSTMETLTLLGIKIFLPEKIQNLPSPKVIITAKRKNTDAAMSYFSLSEILRFDWQVAIGDKIISADEFRKLAESSKGIVKIDETYFLLDPDEVKNILNSLNSKNEKVSSKEMLQTILTGEYKGVSFEPEEKTKEFLEKLLQPEEINIPCDLKADLRPYQERGYKWLYSNAIKGLGSCLADDMGLGKTVQVISVLLKLKQDGKLNNPALVICPTTLVGNWQKECEKFSPSLKVFIYHGQRRKLITRKNDLIITTYGTLRIDLKKFEEKEWSVIIIDEAQNIKNPDTEQARSVKAINADKYIAMSGTPVENRLAELWSIFDFINEGYLGSLGSFKRNYALPIEKYRDKEKIERFRKITSPFILRRLKSDSSIIKDLPDKFVFEEYCYLSKEQTLLYDQIVKTTLDEIKDNTGIQRKGLIFKLITSLKQICNHPSNYNKEENYSKELSGKAEKLIELLEKIIDANEKALIFTQYKEMGEILFGMVKKEFNVEPLFFHGSLTREQRDKMVLDFQEMPEQKFMIVSLKAGGTGLNLTAAANVIHYDLWWNPAVENQATDRTFRIGQDKDVTVHRLITLGTFEEKIDEMLKLKKELADITITEGETWISELSDKELKDLFAYKK